MKQYLAVFFALVLVIGALPGGVFAQGDNLDQSSVEVGEDDLGDNVEEPGDDSGLLPDSPFYFLKQIIENVKVMFTFNEERKTDVLTDLVQLRANELEALELKYDGEELSKKQQSVLDKATKRLEKCAEGLIDRLIGDGEDVEELELTEKEISKLESAFVNLGKAMQRITNTEDDDQDDNKMQMKMEKFQQRIGHLEQVRAKAPESAQKGLNRAIENAQKQQERWQAKHGIGAGKNKERNQGETEENKAEFGEQEQNQSGKQNQNQNGSETHNGQGPKN
ncbi:MAG TPA: hypothetical protein DDY38_07035 [Firmicutes bacterium]|nr:hypothetical protein [Bacillota bacterium]